MKNKLFAVVMTLILCLGLLAAPTGALAAEQARFPTQRGAVTDDANVLSEQLARDIAEFQTLASSRAGVNVQVAIVHFLDGVSVQTYADALFERWNLGDDDFLLLGAVGEDSFASVSGGDVKAKFSDSNAQNLLFTSKFSELFKTQQYDAAFGNYFVAFADMLDKQFSANIPLGNLFANYQAGRTVAASVTQAPNVINSAIAQGSEIWNSIMDSINSNVREYDDYHERRERESNGLTPMGWIVLIILVMIVFGQGKGSRRARKVAGCGCSPLGWIFGLFGLGSILGKKRK